MTTGLLAPILNGTTIFTQNDVPAAGGFVYTYEAGTTTNQATYTTINLTTAQTNPIVLNSAGQLPYPIWLEQNVAYKFQVTDANNNVLGTYDNISGIPNTSGTPQWIASSLTPTYVSPTAFTVTGNQTSVFTSQLRIKATVSAGTVYGTVQSSTYSGGITTVNVVLDSGALDAGLSAIYTSILSSVGSAVPGQYAYYINVADPLYGADPTGVASSTAAFTAAGSTSASPVVYIPSGTYNLATAPAPTGTVTWIIASGVTFTGSGVGTPGVLPGYLIYEEGARSNIIVNLFEFMTEAQIADVTSGSPTLDVSTCFQNLVNYCFAKNRIALIPEVNAKLGSQITSHASVRVMSASSGILNWTSTSSCGWLVTGLGGTGLGIQPADCRVELPQLVGPNDISGYTGVAATNTYNVSTYLGAGLTVSDTFWGSFKVQRLVGWQNAVMVTSSTGNCDNNDFDIGTIDICDQGLYIYSPVGASAPIGQSRFKFKNIFARTPLYISAESGSPGIFECNIDAIQYESPTGNGTCIYMAGTGINNMIIKGRATNSYFSNDSPNTVPTNFRGPLIGGDQTVLSQGGYATGINNYFELYLDEWEPAAGNEYGILIEGQGCRATVVSPPSVSNTFLSTTVSTTQGEANYNGGIGGASVHNLIRVVANVSLTAGSSQKFYFYHQQLNPSNELPIQVVEVDNYYPLTFFAYNNGSTVLREGWLTVYNYSASTVTQQVNVWLRLP
jgi:hypothetical protein